MEPRQLIDDFLKAFEIERYENQYDDKSPERFEIPFSGITYIFHDEYVDSRGRKRYRALKALWEYVQGDNNDNG